MLPLIYRLPKKEFAQTMRHGTRLQHDGIGCSFIPTTAAHSRLGILVTKKFSKKAVERNRIKRQIADAFLPLLKTTTANSKDIVCKIVQPIHQNSFQDIQNTIKTLLPTNA